MKNKTKAQKLNKIRIALDAMTDIAENVIDELDMDHIEFHITPDNTYALLKVNYPEKGGYIYIPI